MSRYLTVVIEINDEAVTKSELPDFHKKMLEKPGAPWRVTAMSLDDEMRRVELIEASLEYDEPEYVIREILDASGVAHKKICDFG